MDNTSEMKQLFGPMIERMSRNDRTFNTLTVRLTSAEMQQLLSDAITRAEDRQKAVEAAREEEERVLNDARARKLNVTGRDYVPPGQMAPEIEREALVQRLSLYRFTQKHLAADAVFELDATSAWAFFGTSSLPGSIGLGYIR